MIMNHVLDDIQEVEDENSSLGKGSYGEVKLFRHKTSQALFAVKIILKEFIQKHSSVSVLLREIQIHKNLHHENIVQMINCFEDEEKVYIVLEYVSKGNLFKIIRRSKGLPEAVAWKYFTQTCLGIKYLHDNGVIHRDLKPENILINENDDVKICDFGWCVQSNEIRNTFCGTLEYMAPEMLKNQGHTYHVDLWALGILLFELINGNAPFLGKSDSEKRRQILSNSINFNEKFSSEAKFLIENLVKPDPQDRLNINQILASDWVQKYCNGQESLQNMIVEHPEMGFGEIVEHVGLVCMVKFGEQFSVLAVNDAKSYVQVPRVTYSGIEQEAFESLEKWCGKKSKDFEVMNGRGNSVDHNKEFEVNNKINVNQSEQNKNENQRENDPLAGVFDYGEPKEISEARVKHSKMRQRGFGSTFITPKKSKTKDLYTKDSSNFQEVFNLLYNIDVSDAALRNREEQLAGLRKTLESSSLQKKKKRGFWDSWFGCLDR